MNTAMVVGGNGIVGRGIVESLSARPNWRTITASRTGERVPGVAEAIATDFLDPERCRKTLQLISPEVTHLFYSAYIPKQSHTDEIEPNRALLANAIEALEANQAPLKHVTLITGAKYYGVHLAPAPTPAEEDHPRFFGPTFYYAQEDYLRSRTDAAWKWTQLIPSHLTGFAVGNPMNLALSIGVYATLCRQAKLPLDFPGTEKAFNAMLHINDAAQLGQAAVWSAESQAEGVFNIANGDPVRWCHLWPKIAQYFNLRCGVPRSVPLSQSMVDQKAVWDKIIVQENLVSTDFDQLVNWHFLQFVLSIESDIVLALNKIRQAGFSNYIDTFEGFRQRFDQYAQERILPKIKS